MGNPSNEERTFPVQTWRVRRDGAGISKSVHMAAYEVYAHVYGAQEALIDLSKNCRGGFGIGELVAFLYARAFPKTEWAARVDEAFKGMEIGG